MAARLDRLECAGPFLGERGLAIYDLGDVVKDHPETLYADDIHFIREWGSGKSAGYTLMATRVADLLAQTWGLKTK